MSLFQTNKPKSAGKIIIPSNKQLEQYIVKTLSNIAQIVGATLGPGGRPVLLERPEINMPPIITKDGVTVVKHLGYHNSIQQLILETVRDAALRTAANAGDGTTTAIVLSHAIASLTAAVVNQYSKISPQKIVREMKNLIPFILSRIDLYRITDVSVEDMLLKVATLSANGDAALAATIIDAFNLVGDEGNITITELIGSTKYEAIRINGYTIERGYEESTKKFSQGFINDRTGTQVVLDEPIFVLFDGVINDVSQIIDSFSKLGQYFVDTGRPHRGVVLVAHGFSDQVLGSLHVNWNTADTFIKVFPLLTPERAILNWRSDFLHDLQAYTGCPIFNPISCPLSTMDPADLVKNNKVTYFECGRFRASVIAEEDPAAIELRVEELKKRRENPQSQYEINDLDVRIGQLTSGIARVNIYAPSQAESREKRDRAEDAWMAVRGAIKHGAVPGGGYIWVRLSADLTSVHQSLQQPLTTRLAAYILSEAFLSPVKLLYQNYGYNEQEITQQLTQLLRDDGNTFDISEQKWVPSFEILDSLPAVTEAIHNSLSIASLLGTIGGIVAFMRDYQTDKAEEAYIRDFEAQTGIRYQEPSNLSE